VTGRWFSLGPPISSTNNTDRQDITEIFLKVELSTIKQTNIQYILHGCFTRANIDNLDIKFSEYDMFPESHSSGTLKVERLEKKSLGVIKPKKIFFVL
jgi:hypothetical protein